MKCCESEYSTLPRRCAGGNNAVHNALHRVRRGRHRDRCRCGAAHASPTTPFPTDAAVFVAARRFPGRCGSASDIGQRVG